MEEITAFAKMKNVLLEKLFDAPKLPIILVEIIAFDDDSFLYLNESDDSVIMRAEKVFRSQAREWGHSGIKFDSTQSVPPDSFKFWLRIAVISITDITAADITADDHDKYLSTLRRNFFLLKHLISSSWKR